MRSIFLAAVALAAPAAAGLRDQGPRGSAISSRSAADIAGCVALQMTAARGYEIRNLDVDNAKEFRLIMRVAGIAAVVGVVRIEDRGANREILTYSTGRSGGAPAAITASTLSCAVD